MKNIVLCDLDGTLADIEHRRHLVTNGNNKWNKFYEACIDDNPNIAVISAMKSFHLSKMNLHIVSGRSDLVKEKTLIWLVKHEIPFHRLTMRTEGDYTPDDVLKLNWLNSGELGSRDNILCVLDDRDKVVKMWRGEGLTCFQVAEGNF